MDSNLQVDAQIYATRVGTYSHGLDLYSFYSDGRSRALTSHGRNRVRSHDRIRFRDRVRIRSCRSLHILRARRILRGVCACECDYGTYRWKKEHAM